MKKLKIGVIGCGGIAGLHLGLLAQRGDAVELDAVADVREDAARAAAEKYQVRTYGTDPLALVSSKIDAVFVCAPTRHHAALAALAMRRGIHVFCEKPMARWVPAAEAMAFLSRKTGAHLQVGFVRRFDDEWLAFRETIQAGKIGKPVVWQDIQSHAGPAAAWYCQDEIGGGPFLDGAIHTIDFALYTFGPAEWVFANARSFREASTALDTGSATIRFQSGDELLLAWSWGLPKGCSGQRIFQLLGPSGTVRWNGVPAGSKTGSFVVHQGDRQEEVAYPANALMKGYERQIDEFLAVARGEAQPRAGSREGVDALRVANAIIQSGRTASVIRL